MLRYACKQAVQGPRLLHAERRVCEAAPLLPLPLLLTQRLRQVLLEFPDSRQGSLLLQTEICLIG